VAGIPQKPVIKPGKKLKRFQWKKVPNGKIEGTVWQKLGQQHGGDIAVDTATIEELFQVKEAPKPSAGTPGRSPKKVVKTCVDPKRGNQVGIGLARMKKSQKEIFKAIAELDDSAIDVDELEQLRGLVPTPEEVTQVVEFAAANPGEKLDGADHFFMHFESMPAVRERIQVSCNRTLFGRFRASLTLFISLPTPPPRSGWVSERSLVASKT
jgi:Formin Homology 2 Domain